MRRRLDPDDRYAEVLRAALKAAQEYGWSEMTRDHIAAIADASPALVSIRIGSMKQVRDAVMAEAVRAGVLSVVAQGITARHPLALAAPLPLQQSALASLLPRRV